MCKADLGHWPVLKWSRFTAFPYQHLQALSITEFRTMYGSIAFVIFFLFALSILYVGVCCSVFGPCSDQVRPSFLYILLSIIATPTRMYRAHLEGMYAQAASTRRARHIWASSFWDVDKTEKSLTRSSAVVSLNAFFIDLGLAACWTLALAYLIRSGVASIWLPIAIGVLALEYCIRLQFHSYIQLQWFVSTLEFRTYLQGTPSIAKLLSLLMARHFFRALIIALFLLGSLSLAHLSWLAGSTLLRFKAQMPILGKWLVAFLSLSMGLGACFTFCLSCYELWNLVRDTIWRVRRIWWHNGQERQLVSTTTHDRETQLV